MCVIVYEEIVEEGLACARRRELHPVPFPLARHPLTWPLSLVGFHRRKAGACAPGDGRKKRQVGAGAAGARRHRASEERDRCGLEVST